MHNHTIYLHIGDRVNLETFCPHVHRDDVYVVWKGSCPNQIIDIFKLSDTEGPIKYDIKEDAYLIHGTGSSFKILYKDLDGEYTWLDIQDVVPHDHRSIACGGPAVGIYNIFQT